MFDKIKLALSAWRMLSEVEKMDKQSLIKAAVVAVGALVASLVAAFTPDSAVSQSEFIQGAVAAITTALAYLKQSPVTES